MKKIFLFTLSLLATPAFAATSPDGSIQAAVQAAIEASASTLILPQAIMWLGAFMGLQFFITNFGLLKSGADIEAVYGRLIGSVAWFSICVYILQNAPDLIDTVGTGILQKFMPDWISPGYILAAIAGIIGTLLGTIGLTGIMALGNGAPMISLVAIIVLLVVIAVALGLAMKIFMLKLELGLIVMLSPLSFAFLGLDALKDQGIAPFKALISLVYRAILLGVICVAFKEVSTTAEAALKAIEWGVLPTKWIDGAQIMIASIFAYPMLGYLVWKSDSIASSLASGSTNMGTADVASAVAAGVAAGGLANAAAGAIGATKPIESMSNFLRGLGSGGSTSIGNAGSMGSGGGSDRSAENNFNPISSSSASLGDAPVPPEPPPSPFETGSKGQPLPPTPKSSSTGGDLASTLSPEKNIPAADGSGKIAGIGSGTGAPAPAQEESPWSKLGKAFGNVGQHLQNEKAATHISINTHRSD